MEKKFLRLSFKQILIIVVPHLIVALFTCIAFSQLITTILNASIADKAASTAEKIAYETRLSLGQEGFKTTEKNLSKLNAIVSPITLAKEIKINKTTICVINKEGLFLTSKDPNAVLKQNYFDQSKLTDYTPEEFLDGKAKNFVSKGLFYAVQPIEGSDWFAVIEGTMLEYTSQLTAIFNIIFIIIILLIGGCIIFNGFITNRTNSKEQEISKELLSQTQNLAVSSKETAATAQDQSAAVKEIVTTMEDNTQLSEDISQKIKDVSGVALKTNGDVAEGVAFIEKNVKQLQEIAETNQNTITGIKSLGDKIENIWDIVSLINSVADQAKIIAFNAELEASSAGEAGKNFHIVATEIRRLADGIIDGTKEIKGKISEIQESSDSLILASENGTEKISEGVECAKNLEEKFGNIKAASEITAASAGKITTIIQQQAVASEQILVTLKQIASGVENFTAATDNISTASQKLQTIAEELGK